MIVVTANYSTLTYVNFSNILINAHMYSDDNPLVNWATHFWKRHWCDMTQHLKRPPRVGSKEDFENPSLCLTDVPSCKHCLHMKLLSQYYHYSEHCYCRFSFSHFSCCSFSIRVKILLLGSCCSMPEHATMRWQRRASPTHLSFVHTYI